MSELYASFEFRAKSRTPPWLQQNHAIFIETESHKFVSCFKMPEASGTAGG
jgi:hypothetical protein